MICNRDDLNCEIRTNGEFQRECRGVPAMSKVYVASLLEFIFDDLDGMLGCHRMFGVNQTIRHV